MRPAFHSFSDSMHYRRGFRAGFIVIISLIVLTVALFILWSNDLLDGLGGWIPKHSSKQVIVYTPTPVPSPTPVPQEESKAVTHITPSPIVEATPSPTESTIKATVISNILNVRRGPSTKDQVIGRLYEGDEIEIIEPGEWCVIAYEDDFGYVSKDFLEIDPSLLPTPTPSPTVEVTATPTSSPTPTPSPSPSPTPEPPAQIIEQHWEYDEGDLHISIDKIREDKVTYYVADVKCPSTSFLTALASETAEVGAKDRPSTLAKNAEAILAINGDYCGYRDTGVVIRNGQLLRDEPNEEMVVLYEDGRLETYELEDISAEDMMLGGALQGWSFGPILVNDGVAYDNFRSKSALWKLNPRTGIGMIAPGHYMLIVVDGRQEASEGMTLDSFAALFERLGCQTAYNLDGGATSIMIFEGEIINNPSGTYERQTSDIIYFK